MVQKTLQIKKNTKERLNLHKEHGDGYNRTIIRLLDKWERYYGITKQNQQETKG